MSVTINLESKPAEVTNLSLTTSEANSTITAGTGDGTYVWERTDNVAHTATLTFDTGIEMLAQDITVTSSDDTKIDCGTVSVSGTKASVKLTYKSGNSNPQAGGGQQPPLSPAGPGAAPGAGGFPGPEPQGRRLFRGPGHPL